MRGTVDWACARTTGHYNADHPVPHNGTDPQDRVGHLCWTCRFKGTWTCQCDFPPTAAWLHTSDPPGPLPCRPHPSPQAPPHHRPRLLPRTPPTGPAPHHRPLPAGLTPSYCEEQYLFVQPQVLLAGAKNLCWLRLSEVAQGATYLLLHLRVLVSDSVQQDGGQPYSDKVRWQGQAQPRPTAWLSLTGPASAASGTHTAPSVHRAGRGLWNPLAACSEVTLATFTPTFQPRPHFRRLSSPAGSELL